MGLDLVLSFILTWVIGLFPPALIRFIFFRRPIEKGWAIGIVAFLWIFNVVLFSALGSQSKTHAALFLVACVSYAILRKGDKLPAAKNNFEYITDGETRSVAKEMGKKDSTEFSANPIMLVSLGVIAVSVIIITITSLDLASRDNSSASKQNFARAQNSVSIFQENQTPSIGFDEEVRTVRLKAEQGDVDAQFNLGLLYYQGRVVTQGDREAMRWFRAAAEQGHGTALNNLGYMYQEGRGALQDEREAVKWYRLAAEQGNVDGQYNLGLSYQEGRGVIQSNEEAYGWWSVAAKRGDSMAQKNLEMIQSKMTPTQIERGQQLAKERWERIRK
jgi:hypothetical protein